MKFKKLIPLRYRTKLVRQFGLAKLVRLPNGQHQLLGGTNAERIAANEWVSLCAHDIVFTHCQEPMPTSLQSSRLGVLA